MDIKGLSFHETADLVIMGGQYAYLGIKKEESGTSLIYVESEGTDHWRNEKILLVPVPLSVNVITLRLKLQEEEGKCWFVCPIAWKMAYLKTQVCICTIRSYMGRC